MQPSTTTGRLNTRIGRRSVSCAGALLLLGCAAAAARDFPVVDTAQGECYDDSGTVIACPGPGEPFAGQDAQHEGRAPAYMDNGDGTITDVVTDLMWQRDPGAKVTWEEAMGAASLVTTGGYTDWRLPTIKELYSLIDFTGVTGTSAATSTPYIDTGFFVFTYGDESVERFIDSQYCSSTEYVSTTMNGDHTVFGVNFADGRIKGYGTTMPNGSEKLFHALYVRGAQDFGQNSFSDNGDGTVTDWATGLTWAQADSGVGMTWEEALAWVESLNSESYLGHDNWRLSDAKELQSLVDYDRSPDTTGTPAIDPVFQTTLLPDGEYPYFWTSTTHLDGPTDIRGARAVYIAFGEALGWMEMPANSGNYQLLDVHGAGAQRSDPKTGDPDDYPYGHGPQGDVIRIYNFVRPVRGGNPLTEIFFDDFETGDILEWNE